MLVYAKSSIKDYGPIERIAPYVCCIVYAIEYRDGKQNYAVYPLREKGYDYSSVEQPDPLFFAADNFKKIADLTSGTWQTAQPYASEASVFSFAEWFTNDIAGKAHDWDLESDDYTILTPIMREYNDLYWNYLDENKITLNRKGVDYLWPEE